MNVSEDTLKLPFSYARRFGIFARDQGDVTQMIVRPGVSSRAFVEAKRFLGQYGEFELLSLDEESFEIELNAAYEQSSSDAMQMVEGIGGEMDLESLAQAVPESEDLIGNEDDAPIIRLINAVLSEAVKEGASDVHIETYERSLLVRFRVDGVLREAVQPRRELASLLVSRIKVMAKLDIAEKRVPQDGRISIRIAGREIDVRVSTLPSNYGERVVLRLLDKNSSRIDLAVLGMDDESNKRLTQVIAKPHGIFLVTGPTGSGKSTTLYAALSEINDNTRNILTIEDPIEYNLEGIGQTQVNTKADMTFARGLRAMLRQDPDVVMVGEVRDGETAEIAVQASLTGHMVMSTLHTNSAVGAITRLQDMGIEPFLLASSLEGILAQRLVRTLCSDCKQPHLPDEFEMNFLHISDTTNDVLFRAEGCANCNHTGYKGRSGIYELIVVDVEMKRLIQSHADEAEIVRYARSCTPSIQSDGIRKVREGITTVEEILRVTQEQ